MFYVKFLVIGLLQLLAVNSALAGPPPFDSSLFKITHSYGYPPNNPSKVLLIGTYNGNYNPMSFWGNPATGEFFEIKVDWAVYHGVPVIRLGDNEELLIFNRGIPSISGVFYGNRNYLHVLSGDQHAGPLVALSDSVIANAQQRIVDGTLKLKALPIPQKFGNAYEFDRGGIRTFMIEVGYNGYATDYLLVTDGINPVEKYVFKKDAFGFEGGGGFYEAGGLTGDGSWFQPSEDESTRKYVKFVPKSDAKLEALINELAQNGLAPSQVVPFAESPCGLFFKTN